MMEQLLKSEFLLIPIAVLAIGLLPITSDYYTLLRIIVCLFGFVAFFALPQDYSKEKVVFLIIAIVYNPIFPIYLGSKIIWFPINLVTIWFFWRLRAEMKEYDR